MHPVAAAYWIGTTSESTSREEVLTLIFKGVEVGRCAEPLGSPAGHRGDAEWQSNARFTGGSQEFGG